MGRAPSGRLLFGSFQRERFYRDAEPRWRDLARHRRLRVRARRLRRAPRARGRAGRGARSTAAIRSARVVAGLRRARLRRLLSAWERPGQDDVPRHRPPLRDDLERRARAGPRGCARGRTASSSGRRPTWSAGHRAPGRHAAGPSSRGVPAGAALTNRMVAYVGQSGAYAASQHRTHPQRIDAQRLGVGGPARRGHRILHQLGLLPGGERRRARHRARAPAAARARPAAARAAAAAGAAAARSATRTMSS